MDCSSMGGITIKVESKSHGIFNQKIATNAVWGAKAIIASEVSVVPVLGRKSHRQLRNQSCFQFWTCLNQ